MVHSLEIEYIESGRFLSLQVTEIILWKQPSKFRILRKDFFLLGGGKINH